MVVSKSGKQAWPEARHRLLAALVLFFAQQLPGLAQMGGGAPEVETNGDPLLIMNGEFRSVYKQARESCSQKALPLIICMGDKMLLIDRNMREEVTIIPPRYSQLKVVDHIPLTLFLLLDQGAGQSLDEKTLQELDKIKKLVLGVRQVLASLDLEPRVLSRQQQLVDLSLQFIERVKAEKNVSHTQLTAFCRQLEPMIMQNVDQAAAKELEIIDSTMRSWREKLGPERFSALTVVIVSGHMPRERHTCFQYFSRLLHVKKEGLKIIYSEGEAEEKAARELVGTHVLDADISETFFKEKMRMHRDLLSDGAARYLRAHPPLSGRAR